LKESPEKPSWFLKKAIKAFYKEQYRKAKWFAFVAKLLYPDDYFAICWYANCLYFSASYAGSYEHHRAAALYEGAIKLKPLHPLAHAGLGRIHYSNAIQIVKNYRIFPGGSWAMFADEYDPDKKGQLGNIGGFADKKCGNRNIAIRELEKAAELTNDPGEKVELLCMAAEIRTYKSNGMGIDAFKHILDINPNYVPAHFHLAGCYAATNQHKQSLKEYEFVHQNAPELAPELAEVIQRHEVNPT